MLDISLPHGMDFNIINLWISRRLYVIVLYVIIYICVHHVDN